MLKRIGRYHPAGARAFRTLFQQAPGRHAIDDGPALREIASRMAAGDATFNRAAYHVCKRHYSGATPRQRRSVIERWRRKAKNDPRNNAWTERSKGNPSVS